MEFGSLEAIKQCVRNGLGISLLPQMAVREALSRQTVVPLDWKGPSITIRARMLHHREKWPSPALSALEKLITSNQAP